MERIPADIVPAGLYILLTIRFIRNEQASVHIYGMKSLELPVRS
jgi:hypothetical protein